MKKVLPRLFFAVVILAGAYALNHYGFLEKTLDWINSFGIWGAGVFLLVYSLACIFFVPSFIFTFSGGILFGLWKGLILSLLGTGAGSLCAFLIGRYLARDFVEKKIGENAEFQRLSAALKRKGWKVILLARFSPVFPFLIGNYAFGVTKMKARHYLMASVLGTIPSALVYTYAGFAAGDLAQWNHEGRARTPGEWLLLGFGLMATLFLAWYLRKFAEKESGQQ
jgi:uncharacterized membrane protein YdjX (TVP38/TMEM64 family)